MKTIIITGATSGIGKAFVEDYKEKANIIAIGRNENKLKALDVRYYVCDLSKLDDVEEMANKISDEVENVDVLVNNAGVGTPTQLDKISKEQIDSMIDTNFKGLVLFTKPFITKMKNVEDSIIINISSTAGITSNPVAPVYCSTKFALEAYTDGLREQLRSLKIRVSAIRPDKVSTNYWGDRDVPRETFLSPSEVAQAIWFVANAPKGVNIKNLTIESVR